MRPHRIDVSTTPCAAGDVATDKMVTNLVSMYSLPKWLREKLVFTFCILNGHARPFSSHTN